jgi:cell division protein FtsB
MKKPVLDKNLESASPKKDKPLISWAFIWVAVTLWFGYTIFSGDSSDEPSTTYYPSKSRFQIEEDSAALAQIAAQNNVKRAVMAQLHDPDSYEPAEFGNVIQYASRTEPYIIYHSYRAKNAFGALMLEEYNFLLRADMSVIRAKPYPR